MSGLNPTGLGNTENFSNAKSDSFSTGKLSNIYWASNYDGANGGQQIQNAIDDAASSDSNPTVVVNGDGPDANGYWTLSSPIEYPNDSHVLYLNCYLYKADEMNEPMHRNADLTNGNDNITIDGRNTVWDNNGDNQTRPSEQEFWRHNVCVHTEGGLTNFSVTAPKNGITIRNTQGWGMSPHDIDSGYISGIRFDQPSKVNRDGVHLVGPITDMTVEHITGITDDDGVIADAGGNESDTSDTTQGPVKDVVFRDINVRGHGSHGAAKVLGNGDYTVENITFERCVFENRGSRAVALLSGDGSNAPSTDQLTDITLRDVRTHDDDGNMIGIKVSTNVGTLTLEDFRHRGNVESLVDVKSGQVGELIMRGNTVIDRSGYPNDTGTAIVNNGTSEVNINVESLKAIRSSGGILEGTNGGTITGSVTGFEVQELQGTAYGENLTDRSPEIKLTSDCPEATASISGVEGSVVPASSSWDPTSAGRDSIVAYIGGQWRLVA